MSQVVIAGFALSARRAIVNTYRHPEEGCRPTTRQSLLLTPMHVLRLGVTALAQPTHLATLQSQKSATGVFH